MSNELLPIEKGLTTTPRPKPPKPTPVSKISRAITSRAASVVHGIGRAVDYAISVLAPQTALNRLQARMAIRSYDAAATSRNNYDVDYRRTDADSELRSKRIRLMGISREEQRNDPFFSNGVRTSRNAVIGDDSSEEGIKVAAATGDENLDAEINKYWNQYKDKIHLRGRWHFNELASVFANSFIVSGEALGVIRDLKPTGSDLPFSIEDLEPDHLPTSNEMWSSGAYAPFAPGPNGGWILDGIEYDVKGRIEAFHILPFHPGNEFLFQPLTTERVPIQRVIHYFEPVRPEQGRGVPFAVSGLNSIFNSNEAIKSELLASRAQANLTVHFKTAPTPLQFNSNGSASPIYDSSGNPVYQLQPGSYTYGENEPVMLKNERVNSQFIPFMKFEGVRGGASMNMSPASYMKDYEGFNFSSLREAKSEDWRGFKNLQGIHKRYFIDKIWPWFIRALVLTDKIKVGSKNIFNINEFAAQPFCGHEVSMPDAGYVNPEQEVKADERSVAMGQKLPEDLIGRRNWKDHCAKWKAQKEVAKAAGMECAWMEGETAGSKKSEGNDDSIEEVKAKKGAA